jgi:hypothetical protein
MSMSMSMPPSSWSCCWCSEGAGGGRDGLEEKEDMDMRLSSASEAGAAWDGEEGEQGAEVEGERWTLGKAKALA